MSPLENVKTDITNRLKNFAMSTLCPRVNPLEGVSRACVAIGERLLKDVAFNRFVQGLAGWVLRHVFERPTTDAMEARRACLGAATFRKLSHMRYEAKELFVKWAAQAENQEPGRVKRNQCKQNKLGTTFLITISNKMTMAKMAGDKLLMEPNASEVCNPFCSNFQKKLRGRSRVRTEA